MAAGRAPSSGASLGATEYPAHLSVERLITALLDAAAPTKVGPAKIARVEDPLRNRLVLAACILGSVIVFVDSTVVNVALPSIRRDLGGGLTLQEWVVDAYLLTLGALLLVGGSLGDLFGPRRLFLIGIVGFGLTSAICAVAPDGTTLILARGLQGIAGAILTPAGLAVITGTFEGEARGAAVGTWTAWTGIAFLIGPLVGGWLVTHASWRWVFLINLPLAVVTLVLVLVAVPKRPPRAERPKVDFLGGLLCGLGLAGPVFALIEAPNRGFGDPLILGTLLGGLVTLALFVLWERRAPAPMLPLELFALRNFSVTNVETLAVYAGLSTFSFFLIIFLQQLAGYSALQSGLAVVPVTVVMFFLSPRVGRFSMRLGPRWFMGTGPLIGAVGLVWLSRLRPDLDYWTDVLPPLVVFGCGLSLTVAPLTATVLADAGERDAGVASGVNNAVARVAGLLGIAVLGALVAGSANSLDVSGYRNAMEITSGLVAAGGVIGLLGIRNPHRSAVQAVEPA